MRSDPQRVLIVDDHPYARLGLRLTLAEAPDLTVVGEAANGAQAVDLCRTLQPDLVLLDLWMPVLDGIQASVAIKALVPHTRVVLLSVVEVPDAHILARAAGADALLSKATPVDALLRIIRQLLRRSPRPTVAAPTPPTPAATACRCTG